jgi:hypothetical protein
MTCIVVRYKGLGCESRFAGSETLFYRVRGLNQEFAEILQSEAFHERLLAFDQVVAEFSFAGLERQNLLFDRAFRDEFVDGYGSFLTYSVRAVHRLGFNGRIPPRVVQDHHVGTRKVQTDATGFEADQKHWRAACLKPVDLCLPIAGASVQVAKWDVRWLQGGGYQAKHPGKLTENEDLMAILDRIADQLQEQLELC